MGPAINHGLLIETAALTDTGKLRENNEDCLFVLDTDAPNTLGAQSFGIYLIADGMGGHNSGEVASETASRIISETLLDSLKPVSRAQSPSHIVKRAIEKANKEIYKLAGAKPELEAMGTTITLGLRLDNQIYIGHVGDSRAYLIRQGRILQLTEDHSLVAYLLKEGKITPQEAEIHPERGKIFRCLGVPGNVGADVLNYTLCNSDSLLFCSDGLNAYVSDDEILDHLLLREAASQTCKKLVNLSNSRGGGDNTSVIVINISL